jgi:hypothetical protein
VREEALRLYDLGFMPIPLRTEQGQRKKPSISWRQYQNERPSRDEVSSWFADMGNVAVVTGRVSGVVVVDLDGKIPDTREWLAKRGFSIKTPIVSTGRGGAHVYYRHPGGTVANGVKLSEVDGVTIDIRADGGYVVAPPSLHDTGAFYEWVVPPETPLAPFPSELASLMNRSTEHTTLKVSDVFENEVETILQPAMQGGRNHAAARVAGFWLKTTKDDEPAAWAALQLWNHQNQPPLPTRELRQTFESILRRRQMVTVSLEPETETGGGDPLPVMDGASWAAAVRDMPPRNGVQARALPTLREIGGLVPRDLIILAGRPGMGKSTCAWNLVAEVGIQGPKLPTVIFSTEMTANDVARWMGAKVFNKDAKELTQDEWHGTLDLIARSNVTMCDAGAVTADQIVQIVQARPETKLVIVDHIQRVVGRLGSGDNRNLEVGRTAVLLKSMAKDVGCTVIALSQMNRGSEQFGKPRLSSLRDSGEIEQEADAVIFLWTKAENLTANPLEVEFYLAKNRHGQMAEMPCMFHKERKTFVQMGIDFELERIRLRDQMAERARAMEAGQ